MLNAVKEKRSRLQMITWYGLPLVVVGGWFFPKLGFFLLACMVGAVGLAFSKGRSWCDWMCPRGSFYDLFLGKISAKREIPAFFRRKGFRVFMLVVLLSVLGTQIYLSWGDIDAIGRAMVTLLTVTTLVGAVLGVVYHQRIWCHFCPMGTLGNFIAEGKRPLTISSACTSCAACAKVCPMQLKPYQYRGNEVMGDNDCIKCSTCVAACPKKALLFAPANGEPEYKKAA
ncbi:MAG: 4Fe-4S binding protein [Nitrospirota bacterium]